MRRLPMMVLLALAWAPHSAIGQVDASSPCEGAGEDPWVAEMHDRMMRFNELVAYALEQHGPVVTCRGAVTTEFGGAKYGDLELEFSAGVTFRIETMPIETSIAVLRAASGFQDEDSVRLLLQDYAAEMGLAIDWHVPEETTLDGERIEAFSDPEPGLNASAWLIYRESTLVGVRLSVAL